MAAPEAQRQCRIRRQAQRKVRGKRFDLVVVMARPGDAPEFECGRPRRLVGDRTLSRLLSVRRRAPTAAAFSVREFGSVR